MQRDELVPMANPPTAADVVAQATVEPTAGALTPAAKEAQGTTVDGRIGYLFAMAMQGLGCEVLAYDPFKNKLIEEAGIPYVSVDEILQRSDVVSLHVPLLPATKHMINVDAVAKLKKGSVLSTSRAARSSTPRRSSPASS